MIYDVKLGGRDHQILNSWYRGALDASGHFGDGEVMFPDDEIVLRRLRDSQKNNKPARLSERNIEMILIWAEEVVANTAIGIDEYGLIKRLLAAIGRNIEDYSHFCLIRKNSI